MAAGSLTLVGCGSSTSTSSNSAPASSPPSSPSPSAVHWGYSATDGPEQWGSLSPEFAACDNGKVQSPIAITTPKPVSRPAPVLAYREAEAEIGNNGHTVLALPGPGNTMTVDGVSYGLTEMHFHTPSENTINAQQFPAEIHLKHESAQGKFAVLAIMLQQGGQQNPAWQPFIEQATDSVEGATTVTTLDWPAMMPKALQTVRFPGSLTTPACTEGVQWLVATSPVTVSEDQLAALRKVFGDNARPVQPVNGRPVTIDQ